MTVWFYFIFSPWSWVQSIMVQPLCLQVIPKFQQARSHQRLDKAGMGQQNLFQYLRGSHFFASGNLRHLYTHILTWVCVGVITHHLNECNVYESHTKESSISNILLHDSGAQGLLCNSIIRRLRIFMQLLLNQENKELHRTCGFSLLMRKGIALKKVWLLTLGPTAA